MHMNEHNTTRRTVLSTAAAAGMMGLAGCTQLVALPEDEPPDPVTQDVTYEIPQYVAADGTPEYSDNGLRFVDYSNILHGIAIPTTAMRQSELGHPDYDESLYYEEMPRLAQRWADLLEDDIMDAFTRVLDGRTWPYLVEEEDLDGWTREGDPQLEDLQHASYTYHMHHRGGRFEEHDGMFRLVTFTPPEYQSALGRFVLDERRDGGQLFHDEDLTELDNRSMGYGLGAAHAHWYAWKRFGAPDGEGDMWRVPEDELVDFLGYNAEVLADVALDIKQEALDDAWDDSIGMYAFDGGTYPIDAVGGILRGLRALGDSLHFYGDMESEALELAEHMARIIDEITTAGITEPWGLPSEVEFTANGVQAASDTVEARRTWEFVNHLTGGYGVTRDRFVNLLEDNQPEALDQVGEITDELLLGVMDYGLDDGELVAELDYGSGDITDDRRSAAAVGIFLPAAINGYGAGDAFERTDGWEDVDSDVIDNTRNLFDTVIDHLDLVENAFLIES